MFEQREVRVRVFLPGPDEKVVDWEAIAKELHAHMIVGRVVAVDWFPSLVDKHTTTRPSRVDTGVDLAISNDPQTGAMRVTFANGYQVLELNDPADNDPFEWDEFHELGFPTEPMSVAVVEAEGEVQP